MTGYQLQLRASKFPRHVTVVFAVDDFMFRCCYLMKTHRDYNILSSGSTHGSVETPKIHGWKHLKISGKNSQTCHRFVLVSGEGRGFQTFVLLLRFCCPIFLSWRRSQLNLQLLQRCWDRRSEKRSTVVQSLDRKVDR